MFINRGGIEQVKLWCEVGSICVVFAVKYISSCVCAVTSLNCNVKTDILRRGQHAPHEVSTMVTMR